MVSDEREKVFMMHRCCVREVRRLEGMRRGFIRTGSELYLSLAYVRLWLSVVVLRVCKCFRELVNIFLCVLPEFVSGVRDMEEGVARGCVERSLGHLVHVIFLGCSHGVQR